MTISVDDPPKVRGMLAKPWFSRFLALAIGMLLVGSATAGFGQGLLEPLDGAAVDSVDATVPLSHTGPPSAPQNVSAAAGPGAGEISLAWDAPADPGNATITHYTIYRGTETGNLSFLTNVSASNTTFVDTGLGDGATFFYQVSASNAFGEGTLSAEVNATTFDLPGAPQALVASTGSGGGEIDLAWDPPADDGGTPVTHYNVYRDGSLVATTNQTSYLDTGLDPDTTYSYEVSAVNLVGEGPTAGPVTASTLEGPGALTSMAAVRGDARGEIQVKFSGPEDDGGNPVIAYNIYRDGAFLVQVDIANLTEGPAPSDWSWIDSGLADGETHLYSVSAVTLAGEGPATGPAQATSPDAPGAPRSLEASASGIGAIHLDWRHPADDGGFRILGYVVYRGTDPGSLSAVAFTEQSSYKDSGLSLTQNYFYRVQAVNDLGGGDLSDLACSSPGPLQDPLESPLGTPCDPLI